MTRVTLQTHTINKQNVLPRVRVLRLRCDSAEQNVPDEKWAQNEADRKTCREFRRLKALSSKSPYLEASLRPTEAAGFAAAGVLVFRRVGGDDVELLMARERRPAKGDRLNFLGGKRRIKAVSALEVAVGKLDSETGRMLAPATLRSMRTDGCVAVHWSPPAKYALFLYEFTNKVDQDVDVRCAGVDGAERLEWVSREDLESTDFVEQEMHAYAAEQLNDLKECQAKRENLFDCARGAHSSVSDVGHAAATDDLAAMLMAMNVAPNKSRDTAVPAVCVECRNSFEISGKECAYFRSMNYDMPRRCKPCRARRRS